ncbi:hypothetical protein SAMN05444921_126116 [Streptomyces wuyuanensis]|uniref:Uncharacterized protein n=1 Tax=Streptomyces wuyuanensis TaxID=1196353 RepID=A0A1H0B8Z8_9ACTN|nr:hypothetical protein SAMN05444921_126116 [Streptomyces wuyuanensis]
MVFTAPPIRPGGRSRARRLSLLPVACLFPWLPAADRLLCLAAQTISTIRVCAVVVRC